ncbi:MAG: DUF177 domain-containing protein [Nitrospinota bacterium]
MKEKREEALIPVNIDDIDIDSGSSLTFERPLNTFFPEGEKAESDRPVEISVTLRPVGSDVYLTGEAKGEIRLRCGRCLAEYPHQLDAELNTSFTVREGGNADEDEEDVYTYDGETVDLYPLVRDQLLLLMPIKPLCREECKGLCPKCGQDLNEKDCGCRRVEVDDRFSVLAKLKKGL